MKGLVLAADFDRLLKLGYGFMGVKSGCCDWTVKLKDGSLDIQALATGHDAVPGLFRVYTVADPDNGLMRFAPGVTLQLTVNRRRRSFGRAKPEVLFQGIFNKLDEFVECARGWIAEGKMRIEIIDTIREIP